jgi:hypothetical protein
MSWDRSVNHLLGFQRRSLAARAPLTGRLVAAAVAAIALGSACSDSGDSRTTARVDRIDGSKACLVPEDAEQTDLQACFPFRREDADLLLPGSCVSVIVPNLLDPEKPDDPLRSIDVLDRRCKR